MSSRIPSIILLVSLGLEPVKAVYVTSRRRSSGGLIAGVVIAAIGFLVFLCILCVIMRRIRARRAYQMNMSGGPAPKPLFGGPWGRQQPVAPMGGAPMGGQSNLGHNGTNVNAPPPYEKPGMNEVSNQGATHSNTTYAPPPVPPPAHTAGQDNTFIGGFRQGNPV
ncbi:hypothetical protein CPB83DRAFT_864596 [Crepidotus variabilis]|uniref:Uncharacterized protein n=1 Tax=Crepidotus variabilis TaxID=179855 RepID=A0A9P6E4J2_9AGAR|nr:hypothetical protein CPB83DRAFT_864596 [Crepidotus variabilis]